MDDSEKIKVIELIKEIRHGSSEIAEKLNGEGTKLNWMYKGPTELIDREEYLLGKTIDKSFEFLNSGVNSNECLGRITEQSNVPKRLLEKTDNTEQVDIAKKVLEDPLYAIRQKELEARKKLLNNPVKLKQIKQMLLERSEKAKKLKKKSKKHLSSQELNYNIVKMLKKFSDKEKRKALKIIMHSASDSSSSEEPSSMEKKTKKKRRHKKYKDKNDHNFSSDDSVNSDVTNSDEDGIKHTKSKRKNKKNFSDSYSSNLSSSSEKESNSKNSKLPTSHYKKQPLSSNLVTNSSDSDCPIRKKKTHTVNSYSNWEKRKETEQRKIHFRNSCGKNKSLIKKYGLMMVDGSEPSLKKSTSIKKYEKKKELKPKFVVLPKAMPLSEREKAEKLKEMVEDAKLRKKDREKDLAYHRKKESQEEESKTYDDDFLRRQMSKLTSHGTMADRIKSNINNIQRSKSAMNSNFMQK